MKMLKNDSLIYIEEESSLRVNRGTKSSKDIKDSDFSASNFLTL